MEIQRQELVAICRRPLLAQINRRTAVRMAAAARAVVGAGGSQNQFLRVVPVPVIGVLIDLSVGAGVGIGRVRANEVRSGIMCHSWPLTVLTKKSSPSEFQS